ncbi:hypothetical protein O3M35_011826 [Rhynocoris fuscipes]|uniref:Glutathione peroxidase n=1 Tax=Rhynocoris fuscipes TaxID=488301 RepID=A0AAW1D260_9HEMI
MAEVSNRGDKSEVICVQSDAGDEPTSIYDFTVNDINGNEVSLEKYKGHVLVIVNIASDRALSTINDSELERLYQLFAETKGLRILAFPSNQFSVNGPESIEELDDYVQTLDVSFDIFETVDVNGDRAHPLWKYLQNKLKGPFCNVGRSIKWNYTKFIVDKNGQPVERIGPITNPATLIESLQKYW